MTTETFANNATSPLAVSVTTTPAQGTQETWTVNSTSSFPQTPGQARFIIDNEIVIGVTPPASGTTLVVTRGAEGTTPATHAAGIQLKQDATAGSLGVFLQTDTTVATPSTTVLGARVTTDTFDRIQIRPQGIFLGTGAAAPDTGLVRVSGWNVDPGGGNVGFIGGDISLPHTGNPSIACSTAAFGFGTSTGGWSSDTTNGDLFVGAASSTNKIMFGNAASGGRSWSFITQDGLFLGSATVVNDLGLVHLPDNTSFGPGAGNVGFTNNVQGALRQSNIVLNFGGSYGFDDQFTYFGSVLNTAGWNLADSQAHDLAITAEWTGRHIRFRAGTNYDGSPSQLSVGTDAVRANVPLIVANAGYASVKLQGGAGTGSIEWWNQAGSTHYLSLYYDGSVLHLQDSVHSRDHVTYTPGTSSTTALTEFASTVIVDGFVRNSVSSISASATVSAAVTLVNATSGAITATLPAAASGLRCEVKKTDSSVNVVSVTPATGTIDGATSFVLTAQYQSVTLVSDGTNWWVV